MTAYYNEIDPFAADWLENLIAAGRIAPGVVDRRSIEDVTADDLRGFTQCHFFAGIGVWSHSLRLAGWPDDRPVWTGSCPCQPFSAAGKGGGVDDKRHLWPAFLWLIRQCRPTEVLGEQVASKDGLGWADLVQSDLEGEDYACGFVDTGSAGHRAPHIRQRLRFAAYDLRSSAGWVADAAVCGREPRQGNGGIRAADNGKSPAAVQSGVEGSSERVADADGARPLPRPQPGVYRGEGGTGPRDGEPERPGSVVGVADANGRNACPEREQRGGQHGLQPQDGGLGGVGDAASPGPLDGFWRDADWLFCRDGKWRPVEPGTFPLASRTPSRVGRLRAYGNAVDAQATKAFVTAYLEATERPNQPTNQPTK